MSELLPRPPWRHPPPALCRTSAPRASRIQDQMPYASSMPPPPKVTHQVQRAAPVFHQGVADRMQRTGQRDVVDVVARRLRHRPFLTPAGHPPINQFVIPAHAFSGPSPAFRSPRAETFKQRIRISQSFSTISCHHRFSDPPQSDLRLRVSTSLAVLGYHADPP